MSECPYCNEPLVFGFHLSALGIGVVAGLVAGLVTFIALTVLTVA